MFVLVRAVTYAALFIGFVLVYLPGRFLSWSGIVAPAATGTPQVAGMIMVTIGTVIALWCVFTFVFIGKGTPAPFDPPRKLVIRGPYRFVRNPMYIGAGMTLAGAALYYESLSIFVYACVFFLITHLFVVLYEEPTLRRTFGDEYEAYFGGVSRWLPRPSKNGVNGKSDIEHVAIGNGAFGGSDIEGKAAMGSGERGGKRTSFNRAGRRQRS